MALNKFNAIIVIFKVTKFALLRLLANFIS